MARSRNIKPSFFTNDLLAECEPLARILFAGLWTIADREGRLHDRPKKIKVEVLPYDECDVDALLWQLSSRNFIARYSENNERFIQIIAFSKHQNPHLKEAVSEIPGISGTSTILAPDLHHTSPALTLNPYPLTLNPITDSLVPEPDARTHKKQGVTLDELSVDHVDDWLTAKRVGGVYMTIDEHALLEKFKDYCRSTGKKYKDYVAAYRNAFNWNNAPLKGQKNGKQPTKHERAQAALTNGLAGYLADLGEPVASITMAKFPDFQRVREGTRGTGSHIPGLCDGTPRPANGRDQESVPTLDGEIIDDAYPG